MEYSEKMQMYDGGKTIYRSAGHLVTGLLQLIGGIDMVIYGILLLTVRYDEDYRNHWDFFSAGIWSGASIFAAGALGIAAYKCTKPLIPYIIVSLVAACECVACCVFSALSGADNLHRIKGQPGYVNFDEPDQPEISYLKLSFNLTLFIISFLEIIVCLVALGISLRKLTSRS